jgi:hypothetical protein
MPPSICSPLPLPPALPLQLLAEAALAYGEENLAPSDVKGESTFLFSILFLFQREGVGGRVGRRAGGWVGGRAGGRLVGGWWGLHVMLWGGELGAWMHSRCCGQGLPVAPCQACGGPTCEASHRVAGAGSSQGCQCVRLAHLPRRVLPVPLPLCGGAEFHALVFCLSCECPEVVGGVGAGAVGLVAIILYAPLHVYTWHMLTENTQSARPTAPVP